MDTHAMGGGGPRSQLQEVQLLGFVERAYFTLTDSQAGGAGNHRSLIEDSGRGKKKEVFHKNSLESEKGGWGLMTSQERAERSHPPCDDEKPPEFSGNTLGAPTRPLSRSDGKSPNQKRGREGGGCWRSVFVQRRRSNLLVFFFKLSRRGEALRSSPLCLLWEKKASGKKTTRKKKRTGQKM